MESRIDFILFWIFYFSIIHTEASVLVAACGEPRTHACLCVYCLIWNDHYKSNTILQQSPEQCFGGNSFRIGLELHAVLQS